MLKRTKYILTIAIILGAISFVPLVGAKNNSQVQNNESSNLKNVIPDAAITTDIKARYLADEKLNAMCIKVETVNGNVNLYGFVKNKEEEEAAVSIARKVYGVKQVISKLEVVKE